MFGRENDYQNNRRRKELKGRVEEKEAKRELTSQGKRKKGRGCRWYEERRERGKEKDEMANKK